MPTPKKGPRLAGGPAQQRALLANLATALFEHRRITTTEAKARALRPLAEKLITKAKKAELGTTASLHNRRQVLRTITDASVVHELFTEIAPSFAERPGGYTRIIKLGPRKGDNAPLAMIELVQEPYEPKQKAAKPTAEPVATTEAAPVADAGSEAPADAEPDTDTDAGADAESAPEVDAGAEPAAAAEAGDPADDATDEKD